MAEIKGIFGVDGLDELAEVSLELERIDDLAQGVSKTLTGAFRAAVLEGRSLKTLLADIGKNFADIALKAALKPFGNLVTGLVEGVFNATNPLLQNIHPFAKGGVISTPGLFDMGGGNVGLAGEAGPEAIMPLKRGADGRLGVEASGNGSVTINFNVTAKDARSFTGAEAEISALLLRAVKRGTRAS